MTWQEAREYCEELGGYLATFTTEDEWVEIHEVIKEHKKQYWFGGYGNGAIDTWKWVTGEEWSYSDWCPGEPNNDYGGTENYLGTYTSSYRWNDYKPNRTFGFICEYGDIKKLPIPYKSGWAIANSAPCFGYDENYRLSSDLYYDVLNPAGAFLHSIFNKWGGSCFGMSLLSAMIDNGQLNLGNYFSGKNSSLFCNYSFDSIANNVLRLDNKDVIRLIERCQISQNSPEFKDAEVDITDIVDFFSDNDISLIFASMNMQHAIVISGKTEPVFLGDGWYEFDVYDPNFPITDAVDELNKPAWFYNQEVGRNRKILINPDQKKWRYETYASKDKYGYYSDEFLDGIRGDTKIYDPTKLDSGFLNSKLKITDYNLQNIYLYNDIGSLKIYDSSKDVVLYEKRPDYLYINDSIDFFPLVAGNEYTENPTAYLTVDMQDLTIVADNSKYAIIGNDNFSFVNTLGESTAEVDIENSNTNISSHNNAGVSIKFGAAIDDEYSIIDLEGRMEDEEYIGLHIGKDNSVNISGTTNGNFDVTVENTYLDDPKVNNMTSDELRSVSNIEDFNFSRSSFGSKISGWAEDEVEEAYEEGLIPNILLGEDLRKRVNRAEFASIAVELYEKLSGNEALAETNPFNDITSNPCRIDILKAYKLNIAVGTSSNTFEPDSFITREQMATMLCRAYKKSEFSNWSLANDDKYPLNYMGVKKFDDDNEISDFAKESVYFMTRWGIINGVGLNHFAPKGNVSLGEAYGYATREQAIAIALRSLKHLD